MAMTHSTTEPTMALSRPPGEPAAGVSMVNTFRLIPPTPLVIRLQKIRARAARATAAVK